MTVFIPNPLFKAELERTLSMQVALHEAAEDIVAKARVIAPVDTGAYRDSIHVEDSEHVQVVADVPYAGYIEFGTSQTPAFAVLRRAAE